MVCKTIGQCARVSSTLTLPTNGIQPMIYRRMNSISNGESQLLGFCREANTGACRELRATRGGGQINFCDGKNLVAADSHPTHKFATLAQLVEQHFCKVKVPGPSPGGGSKNQDIRLDFL